MSAPQRPQCAQPEPNRALLRPSRSPLVPSRALMTALAVALLLNVPTTYIRAATRTENSLRNAVPGPAPYASSTLNFAPSSPAAHAGPTDPTTTSSAAGASAPGSPSAASPGSADPGEDIRDIRGPKYLFPAWLIAALVVAGVLLALAAYGGWRWLRGRRQRARVLLPFELALQRLEELRPLMLPERAREFSIAVSDIVRLYIEQRFDITATHRTTEEFLRDLLESSQPSLVRHRGLLSRFLQQCDLVKFGGMSLSQQDIESLQQSARAFVLETAKPDPAPDPPGIAIAKATAAAAATVSAAATATAKASATNTSTSA